MLAEWRLSAIEMTLVVFLLMAECLNANLEASPFGSNTQFSKNYIVVSFLR